MSITINHQTNDISATSGSVTIDGAAVGGFGFGQTWQDVKASRSPYAVYTNNTGKPIALYIEMSYTNANGMLIVNGSLLASVGELDADATPRRHSITTVIPDGQTYYLADLVNVTGSPNNATILQWRELR